MTHPVPTEGREGHGTAGHTPGPWRVDPDERDGMEYNNHVITESGDRICFMAHAGHDRQAEFDANARLIAAAPDLLAALQECLREHGGYTIKGECERRARAALALAEGR